MTTGSLSPKLPKQHWKNLKRRKHPLCVGRNRHERLSGNERAAYFRSLLEGEVNLMLDGRTYRLVVDDYALILVGTPTRSVPAPVPALVGWR